MASGVYASTQKSHAIIELTIAKASVTADALLDDRRESVEIEGFSQHHKGTKTGEVAFRRCAPGHDHDRHVAQLSRRAHRREHFNAVHPRQDKIKHNEGGRDRIQDAERFRAVLDRNHPVAVEQEVLLNQASERVIVFDDEHYFKWDGHHRVTRLAGGSHQASRALGERVLRGGMVLRGTVDWRRRHSEARRR
jgi:hypothetical protein